MTTLTLTIDPAGDPSPFIDVLAEDFPGGVETVTVWRTVAGRAFKVRGLVGVSAGGTVTTRDFEAPFDVESSYRVEQFDSAGEFVSWSDPEVATLTGDGRTWIHNPVDPATAVQVDMLSTAADELVRPIDSEVFRIRGRSAGVTLFGTRWGLTQVVLDCLTHSLLDAARFDALFGGYDDSETVPILCIRTPPAMLLPPTLFAVVAAPRQIAWDNTDPLETVKWGLVGDEVSPPAEAVVIALLGYDDFTAFYADYDAFEAAYTDYQEAQRDYSIAGTA